MSDVPPEPSQQGPTEESNPPVARSRGIRAGRAAQRKRKAYIRYRLQVEPDLSEDQIYLLHSDKSSRPLYSRPGWTPDNLDDDDCVIVETEVPQPKTPPQSPPLAKSPLIPPAAGVVPGYGRLFGTAKQPPPPPPAPKLRPTAKIASKPVAEKPKAPVRLVPKEPSHPPPARIEVAAPVEKASSSASSAPVEKASSSASSAEGFIDSNILGHGTLLISPVTNRRVKLRDSIRNPVTRVVLLDFHNTIDRYFVPGQRRPYTIQYPNARPTLLPEVVTTVKKFVAAAAEDQDHQTCVVICSHINNSLANEQWLRDCAVNSCEDVGEIGATERCLLDLVIVTRQRVGPRGKYSIARRVFPSAEFLILDDNTEVATEFIRAGQQSFHIQLPRRERSTLGRSYANIFEAEDATLAWIRRPHS